MAGKRVDETFAGQFRSVFRGSGMEFDEVREYSPGDDVRALDWNVTARAGKPFVKRYTEERERRVVLVVDVSGSQRFGTAEGFKLELAAEVAALLAACANRSNDKIGLVAFTDRVEHFVPAKKGPRHAGRVIRDVLGVEPKRAGTDLAGVLDEVNRTVRRGAILVVISDFLDTQASQADGPLSFEKALVRAARRHDVICVRALDARELDLPSVGVVRLADLETGEVREVDTSDAGVRAAFRRASSRQRESIALLMRRAGADFVELVNGADYVEPLRRLFDRRARRRGLRRVHR